MIDKDQRGLICYFTDGTTLALEFPKQTDNKAAIQLKLNSILESRQMLLEIEGLLYVIPFENLKYFRVYPAPASIEGHTYIKGVSVA